MIDHFYLSKRVVFFFQANARNADGLTPLFVAVFGNDLSLVKMLVEEGEADPVSRYIVYIKILHLGKL